MGEGVWTVMVESKSGAEEVVEQVVEQEHERAEEKA